MSKVTTESCKAFITKILSESDNQELAQELLNNFSHTDIAAQNLWQRYEKFKIKSVDQILDQNAWFVEFDDQDFDVCNRPSNFTSLIGGTLRGFGYKGSVSAEFVIVSDDSDSNIVAWALHTD